MSSPEILQSTITIIQRVLEDKGLPPAAVDSSTVLLGSALGIDSLDLATIVVQLSESAGKDPFEGGFTSFRTVGELASLYCA